MFRTTVALIAATIASSASAGYTTYIVSAPNPLGSFGAFTGTVDWTPITAYTSTVTVKINNMTSNDLGGFITGLVFRTYGEATSQMTASSDADFHTLVTNVAVAPANGTFSKGAGVGGLFGGSGTPSLGLAAGTSGTFTFALTSSQPSWSSMPDLSALSFGISFEGFANGSSGPVWAEVVPAAGTFAVVLLAAGIPQSRRRFARI